MSNEEILEETPLPPKVIDRGLKFLVGFNQGKNEFRSFTLQSPKGKLRREYINSLSGGAVKARIVALRHVLQSLGALDPLPAQAAAYLSKIPVPDAELIDFYATYAAYGGKVSFPCTCTNCSKEFSSTVDLNEVRMLGDTQEPKFDSEGRAYIGGSFFDPAEGRDIEVEFRIPTLGDQMKFVEKLNKDTIGDVTFFNLVMLMHSYDGHAPLTLAQMDELPLASFDAIMALNKKVSPPGIDTDVIAVCPYCQSEVKADLPVDKWLDPFVPQKQ